MKALGKQSVVSLPEAVSIVVAVNGKFLSLPTINLTTLPLACSAAGSRGKREGLGWEERLSRCVSSEGLRGPSTLSSSPPFSRTKSAFSFRVLGEQAEA